MAQNARLYADIYLARVARQVRRIGDCPAMILVTGANGFIGRALVAELRSRQMNFRAAVRSQALAGEYEIGDIAASTDWSAALQGISCVIHTAARVHDMREATADPLAQYRAINLDGTINLARQAAASGVRRFIFLSTIKVNGDATEAGKAFTAEGTPNCADAYAISKLEAERELVRLARETGLEVVIIRPPLVYGPGVKGNFLRLLRWLRRGLPLPLGAIDNRRSLVAVDNLVDLILTCIDHPAAVGQTLLVSDGHDLSTPELLRKLGATAGYPVRLIPVPAALLEWGLVLIGRGAEAQRLLGSLQVDITGTRELLDWRPPISVDEGLRRMVQAGHEASG